MTTIDDLTAEELARLDGYRTQLLEHYRLVSEHRKPSGAVLGTGTRVHHGGQRWPDAYDNGTATILEVYRCDGPCSWSQTYGRPDVEVIALLDKPWTSERLGLWADYHCGVATEQRPSDRAQAALAQVRTRTNALNEETQP